MYIEPWQRRAVARTRGTWSPGGASSPWVALLF